MSAAQPAICQREIVVLGAGQDAGAPQIGNADDTGPRLLPSSLGVIDRENGQRFLFDATPAISDQMAMMDRIDPPKAGLGIDGVFLTHAHIGHYFGLAYFGREAAGADRVPVFAMYRMAKFLRENAPWSQLVTLDNIALTEMEAGGFTVVSDEFGVLPITVPHRDEFSETVGFLIMTPDKRALYIPDLDSWDDFAEAGGGMLSDLIGGVDYAFIDATFWDDNELKKPDGTGRDMSDIPHPRVSATMDLLADLPASERAKVQFIHYNHTNPIRDPDSTESKEVEARGFNVARRGDRVCLAQ
ncbi:MBL fold metallo-hydrolase [Erythrobacter insulae]|uniref:MBL fold metallo-hydrolase n=2 Tax=Erythrobacter insulae TaxID=2584124 RepID=A0A547PF76_9SPHN|nr:MBL fold metallo-hydrolase [Erythrobacter insulae]